jgi:hypothetical protein
MIKTFALIFGIIYVIAGISGFIPALNPHHMDMPPIAVDSFYGRALGLFPVNILHNFVHLAIGVWGILASRSIGGALVRSWISHFVWAAGDSRLDSGDQYDVRFGSDLRQRRLAARRNCFNRGLFRLYRA